VSDSAEHVYGLQWQQPLQLWSARGCLEAPKWCGVCGVMCCRHGYFLLYRRNWQWSAHKIGFGPVSLSMCLRVVAGLGCVRERVCARDCMYGYAIPSWSRYILGSGVELNKKRDNDC